MKIETVNLLGELGIYPDFKRKVNQTEPTFIDLCYMDIKVKVHKDSSLRTIIECVMQGVSENARRKGVEEGKELIRNELKTILGI